MGLKIINASFSKCGTKTLAQAYRILGYNVCDYVEQLLDVKAGTWDFFDPKLGPTEKTKLLQDLLGEFDVVLDVPFYLIWKELLDAFPEAKVIFWERDIDSWFGSFKKQNEDYWKICGNGWPDWVIDLKKYLLYPKFHAMDRKKNYMSGILLFGSGDFQEYNWRGQMFQMDEVMIKRLYRQHCADVKMNCPREKLLILNGPDCGWEVICNFLDKPIPENQPWPYMNKGGALIDALFTSKVERIPLAMHQEQSHRMNVAKFTLGLVAVAVGMKYRNEITKMINEKLG